MTDINEDSATVTVEHRGSIAIWTLNRPDRMNALSRATVRQLGRLARQTAQNRAIRVVILTGEGDKAFCAGADLKERQGMSMDDVQQFLHLYRASFSAVDAMPQPVIAAINGVAFGGGLELALACDLRVMSSTTHVGLTETSLAIIPGAGGTQRLPRVVGEARAKEMILLAQRLDAAKALAIGLVTRVTEGNESVLDCALRLAEPLVNAAPIAIAAALTAIDAASNMSLEEGLTLERTCYELTLGSQDRLEALAAFAEKRKPVYRGI
ncbi:MAG: enoyl-CoA hydratase/isomerase family protein [Sandaracinaceae bacterium]|nr:enoyl-CoA hydratase/isomerase family protein [Sandaracinaceae bacterium]